MRKPHELQSLILHYITQITFVFHIFIGQEGGEAPSPPTTMTTEKMVGVTIWGWRWGIALQLTRLDLFLGENVGIVIYPWHTSSSTALQTLNKANPDS
jgi:hypothetical protein